MALRKGFGAELALPHGNDLRYDLAGTIARNGAGVVRGGLFPPVASPLLTSSATMAVNVAAFSGVAVRDGGPVLLANDGSATVTPAAAPSSNSRLDVLYAIQHDHSSFVVVPDADDLPVFGVLQGAASASPVRNPAGLPPGALELGTILIPSTATNSGSAGVVITPTFLYTCMAGGAIIFRTAAERDAFVAADGQLGFVLADQAYIYSATLAQWVAVSAPASSNIIPTAVNTGGSVAVNAVTGEVTGSGAITALRLNSTVAILSKYRYIELILQYDGSTAGNHTINPALGTAVDATASSYTTQGGIDNGPSRTTLASGASGAWTNGYTGGRSKRHNEYHFYALASALETFWTMANGVDSNGAGANGLTVSASGEHTVATAFDGLNIAFSGMGTLSNLSAKLVGHI